MDRVARGRGVARVRVCVRRRRDRRGLEGRVPGDGVATGVEVTARVRARSRVAALALTGTVLCTFGTPLPARADAAVSPPQTETLSLQQARALAAVAAPLRPGEAAAGSALVAAADSADVIFLGEWHGFDDNAQVARTLLSGRGADVLALEIGVEAGAVLDDALRSEGLDGARAAFTEAPVSMPFVWWHGDAELAADFVAGRVGRSGRPGRVVGFDREFPWSARLLLDESRPPPGAGAATGSLADSLAALMRQAVEGFGTYLGTGDPSTVLLTAEDPSRLERLARLFAPTAPLWARRLDRLAASSRLDQGLRSGSRDANIERVAGMAAALGEVVSSDPRPRVFVRTGLQHAARGHNFLDYPDMGGRVAEGSPSLTTLHVAVVPIRGTLDAWAPGSAGGVRTFDGVAANARYFDLAPFAAAADAATAAANEGRVEGGARPWTTFDQRGLRGASLPPSVAALVSRFDVLVLVPDATRATFLVPPPR